MAANVSLQLTTNDPPVYITRLQPHHDRPGNRLLHHRQSRHPTASTELPETRTAKL